MNVPLNIDWQQILLHLLNFVILFAILNFLLYNPVKKFMDKRFEYYKGIDDESKKNLQQAEEMKKSDFSFVPYESEEDTGLKELLKMHTDAVNISFMIRPEGGFAPEEIAYLDDMGIKRVTLGPRILRTETAGEATLAILMYELGDMG